MADQVLSGAKVLDLTWHIAGPYCTKLLADHGADVIKVERPGTGDPARSMAPFLGDVPHPERSGLFLHLNTNKRSITLNLKSDAGKKIFSELAKGVDVVVESFSPRVMPSLGLSYQELEKLNPRLVMTSISNFGQTGPYRDFKASELIIYGMGGSMYCNGIPEREPLKKGGRVIEYQAGAHAATATVMALIVVQTQGFGQQVDVSMMETQLGAIDRRMSHIVAYQYNGLPTARPYPTAGLGFGFPFGIHPCQDGRWELAGMGQVFPRTARMLGMPELANDPRFSTLMAQADPASKEAFDEIFLTWSMQRTRKECVDAGQAAGVLCGPINNSKDLADDPHWRARGLWTEIEHTAAGKLTYPGAPIKFGEGGWKVTAPAPALGQHNEEVYSQLGYAKDDLVKLRERGVI